MNLVVGSSSFLQSPFHFPSSSTFCSQSSVFLCVRNAGTKRRNGVPTTASMRQEDRKDDVFRKRRVVLLVGISVLPLLKLRAGAAEGFATKENEINATGESKKSQGLAPSNPFFSFLNGLGIFGSGVLGTLYALTQNKKKATEVTIESMKASLKEKEAAIVSMEKEFESKLLTEQEERTKQLNKAKEVQQLLMNQLNSANATVSGLERELKNEKRIIEQLRVQIDSLQTSLLNAGEDKRALEEEIKQKLDTIESLQDRINLLGLELRDKEDIVQKHSSSLEENKVKLKNLNSIYKQLKDELAKADSEIKKLRDELLKNKKELELKNSVVDELNARVSSLIVERDDSKQKIDVVQKEYEDLKLSSENKAASDAKLLGEREEIHQLKEKLELVLIEASENQATVAKLIQEKNDLRNMLDSELSNVKNLKHELTEQKNIVRESRENMEDARDLVVRLGKKRENFGKRANKLEEELASAKGEILRLRTQINSSKTVVNDKDPQKVADENKVKVEHENKVTVTAKKTGRRRKDRSQ